MRRLNVKPAARALLALGQPMHILRDITLHIVVLQPSLMPELEAMHPIKRLHRAINQVALASAVSPLS